MVQTWGGTGPNSGVVENNSPQQSKLPGFDSFMMTTFSPLCWAIPSDPKFDPKDAQGKQVLAEAAALQKAIYTQTGQVFLDYLRDVELIGMGMDSATTDEYLRALCNTDIKSFQQFFKVEWLLQGLLCLQANFRLGARATEHKLILDHSISAWGSGTV